MCSFLVSFLVLVAAPDASITMGLGAMLLQLRVPKGGRSHLMSRPLLLQQGGFLASSRLAPQLARRRSPLLQGLLPLTAALCLLLHILLATRPLR